MLFFSIFSDILLTKYISKITDCRIYDPTVIIRNRSVVSVLSDRSNNDDHDEPYYGIVVRLINERKFAQIEWFEGNTFNP